MDDFQRQVIKEVIKEYGVKIAYEQYEDEIKSLDFAKIFIESGIDFTSSGNFGRHIFHSIFEYGNHDEIAELINIAAEKGMPLINEGLELFNQLPFILMQNFDADAIKALPLHLLSGADTVLENDQNLLSMVWDKNRELVDWAISLMNQPLHMTEDTEYTPLREFFEQDLFDSFAYAAQKQGISAKDLEGYSLALDRMIKSDNLTLEKIDKVRTLDIEPISANNAFRWLPELSNISSKQSVLVLNIAGMQWNPEQVDRHPLLKKYCDLTAIQSCLMHDEPNTQRWFEAVADQVQQLKDQHGSQWHQELHRQSEQLKEEFKFDADVIDRRMAMINSMQAKEACTDIAKEILGLRAK